MESNHSSILFIPTDDDQFSAKRSGRISAKMMEADNDTWVENIAVVEMSTLTQRRNYDQNKKKSVLKLRSYFESTTNFSRVWDEPPSGASRIQYATEEMRTMAEVQLRDMHIVSMPKKKSDFFLLSNDKKRIISTDDSIKVNGNQEKRGISRFFRRKLPNKSRVTTRIEYKPGSHTSKVCQKSLQKKETYECQYNHELEVAMRKSRRENLCAEEKEDILLAKALSLSE